MGKEFWKAAGIRALRTFCQTFASMITVKFMSEVDWIAVCSASLLAAILSFLTSVTTGLPEVD